MSYTYPRRKGNKVDTFIGQYEFFKHFSMRCENAISDIWCGVSFVDWNFILPNNGKTWWQFLIDLKKEKPDLIIRVLIWRNTAKYWSNSGLINGDQTDLNIIKQHQIDKYLQFKWDQSPNIPHCHHGKYYVIDNKYALIGGMTLNGHKFFDFIHDTFMEIEGPSTVDVINNFKLRWNHNNIFTKPIAMDIFKTTEIEDIKDNKDNNNNDDNDDDNDDDTEEKKSDDEIDEISDDFVDVKICWSCSPNLYPGIDDGVQSIHDEYYNAFKNAKSSIYLESQHMGEYKLLNAMKQKLESDDDFYIIYIVPIWMKNAILREKEKSIKYLKEPYLFDEKPRYHETFQMLSSLNKYKNFCLSGVYHDFNKTKGGGTGTGNDDNNSFWTKTKNAVCNQIPQYIHSKLCIVDGQWFTIGSANMVDISFNKDHTEINGCVWNENEAMKLLKKLAVLHCNKQNENDMFDDWNDKQIIKFMINSSKTNINGLYALDSELYGTAKHAGFLYKMLSSFI